MLYNHLVFQCTVVLVTKAQELYDPLDLYGLPLEVASTVAPVQANVLHWTWRLHLLLLLLKQKHSSATGVPPSSVSHITFLMMGSSHTDAIGGGRGGGRENKLVTIRRVVRRVWEDNKSSIVTCNVHTRPERLLDNGDVVVKPHIWRMKDEGSSMESLKLISMLKTMIINYFLNENMIMLCQVVII